MISNTLLLFDLDGTLVYSDKIDSQCFSNTFKERYKTSFPTIDWTYFSHVTDHTIFREAYKGIRGEYPNAKEIELFRSEFVEKIKLARLANPNDFEIIPGALKLFAYLRQQNIPFALATGGWEAPATVKLKHVGLWQEDLILSGADNRKTRTDIIESAIEKCKRRNYNWEQMVYVGDAIWDVNTCRDMELPLLGIRRMGDHEELHNQGVSHVITDYMELKDLFEQLRQAKVPN